MSKVIVERPRAKGGNQYPKGEKRRYASTPLDEQPKSEKIRLKWKQARQEKEFSERLGPLKRWLYSKVGHIWDDIYSEIRDNLGYDSVIESHVLTHLYGWIEFNVIFENGIPCYGPGRMYGYPISSYSDDTFYINPDNKKLCVIYNTTKGKTVKKEHIWFDKEKLIQIKNINGIWYYVQLELLIKQRYISPVTNRAYSSYSMYNYDPAHKADLSIGQLFNEYGGHYRGISKKQLSSKEIKKLKLR